MKKIQKRKDKRKHNMHCSQSPFTSRVFWGMLGVVVQIGIEIEIQYLLLLWGLIS